MTNGTDRRTVLRDESSRDRISIWETASSRMMIITAARGAGPRNRGASGGNGRQYGVDDAARRGSRGVTKR